MSYHLMCKYEQSSGFVMAFLKLGKDSQIMWAYVPIAFSIHQPDYSETCVKQSDKESTKNVCIWQVDAKYRCKSVQK